MNAVIILTFVLEAIVSSVAAITCGIHYHNGKQTYYLVFTIAFAIITIMAIVATVLAGVSGV